MEKLEAHTSAWYPIPIPHPRGMETHEPTLLERLSAFIMREP